MPFSEKVKVMVWGLQGSRCAFWDCNKLLVVKISDNPERYSVLGEAAHIVAEKTNGPRGQSPLSLSQRNSFSNAILLCTEHHKIIDDNPSEYTVEKLLARKKEHEQAFQNSTQFDATVQNDRERYAEYVDEWIVRARVKDWSAWTSWLLGGDLPRLRVVVDKDLQKTVEWIFNRVWPGRYLDLENAFTNFRVVLRDLLTVFHKHSVKHDTMWFTEKFYKEPGRWVPEEEYNRRGLEYDFHVDLIFDLVLELTRAGNLLCDRIRARVDPEFRIAEGVLTVQAGPYMDLSYKTYRSEYKPGERDGIPYPGLKEFKAIRSNRDISIGVGAGIDDPETLRDLVERRNTFPFPE